MKRAKREALAREAERLRVERARAEAESLIHRDAASFEADDRVGARLLREDGSTWVERVPGPERWLPVSPAVLPPSAVAGVLPGGGWGITR